MLRFGFFWAQVSYVYDYRTVGIPDSCYLLKQKRSFMMIKLVLKLLLFFCCLAELHASRQRLIANVFFVWLVFFGFFIVLHRDSAKPNGLYFPSHLQIAWSRSFFLCQFVLSRPSCLTKQQYYLSVHLSYFRNCLVCMFWFEETACLLSFKWPLNTPKEDLILFSTPCLCVKGHVSVHCDVFCVLCNVADCHFGGGFWGFF